MVVFPEAYGGNPETGASMALISYTLCVVSIPLMYALMVAIFGMPFGTKTKMRVSHTILSTLHTFP